ncbi:MAG: primosomal protein N', partial [Chitinophagaceae bacterium]|nr:primosomal protein N' [Chitinophagaceae bacterium]
MPELKDITLQEVQKIVQDTSAWKVVNALLDKGLISVYENLNENYRPKKENFVFLNAVYQDETALRILLDQFEKKPHYQNLILTFLHEMQTKKVVSQQELIKRSLATSAQVKYLADKQVFEIRKLEVDRVQFETVEEITVNVLNAFQQQAYEKIRSSFANSKPVLLKGITGSGKTHIYFKLIEDCIQQGKQALYLLPEIALTAQIVKKLRSTFGNRIGIYHSRFSNQERVELWRKVQNKEFDVVIGSRSALLLPFKVLGLIIVDEEHDSSYKQQDPAPRYHARDAALYLAHQMGARILLGTATPSIESYYNCKQEKFDLVELNQRYGTATLPATKVIDIKVEMANRTFVKGIFSEALIMAIQHSIENKKQVILFQNRRGYAPFVQCEMCGWVPQCKNCDVSLTFHKATDKLHCHYCQATSPLVN